MSNHGLSPLSTLDAFRAQADEVKETFAVLLGHCDLRHDDINARTDGVVFVGWNPDRWAPLPNAAQRHVGDATKAWKSLKDLAEQAVLSSAPERLASLTGVDELLSRIIEQDNTSRGAPARWVRPPTVRPDRAHP